MTLNNSSALAPYPWQVQSAKDFAARRERWPHAILLYGPAGHGKHHLARTFAQALLCETTSPAGFACGQCESCRLFATENHPDFRLLAPEIESDEARSSNVITIAQIRTLNDFIVLTSHRQKAKVVMIDPAEAMNPSAANALLKTLEEPPLGTYFLLVSHRAHRLLATIISRCHKVPSPQSSNEQAVAWLKEQNVTEPHLLLAQAGGAPLAAQKLAAQQSARQTFLLTLAEPARLSPIKMGGELDTVPKNERRERLQHWLSWLQAWVYDLAQVKYGNEVRYNPDYAAAMQQLAARLAPKPLFRYYRDLLTQQALLNHPLQPRLVAELLLVQYRQLWQQTS